MSAGSFTRTLYQANNGDVFLARVQPETITSWNPAPTGAVTVRIRANMTGGQRQNGMNARYVLGKWTTAPAGYKPDGTVKLPILTQAAFDALQLDQSLASNGGTFVVTGLVNGKRR